MSTIRCAACPSPPPDDERYVVVAGRRWRRADPGVPGALRAELVAELMDARRAVGAASRRGDRTLEAAARERVHDAKVALGERGVAWWVDAADLDPEERRTRIVSATLALLRHRHPSTICPSDVARTVGGARWRSRLDEVREVAFALAADGRLEVRQHGEVVDDPRAVRGPVRLALVEAPGCRRMAAR